MQYVGSAPQRVPGKIMKSSQGGFNTSSPTLGKPIVASSPDVNVGNTEDSKSQASSAKSQPTALFKRYVIICRGHSGVVMNDAM